MLNTDGRPTLHNCQPTIMKSPPTKTYCQVCPRQNDSALESADSGDLFQQEAARGEGPQPGGALFYVPLVSQRVT